MRLVLPLLLLTSCVALAAGEGSVKELNACDLILDKEAVAVLGKPVTVPAQKAGALPSCQYRATALESITVTLYGEGEPFEKRIEWAEMTWGKKQEPVPGLGDRAVRVWRQLFVEKKPVLFAVTLVHPMSDDEASKHLTALAKLALSRLP